MLLTSQVYNKKGSDVYNMALKLRAHITKLFEVILDSALQMIIVSWIMWWDGVVVCDFEGPDLYQKTSFWDCCAFISQKYVSRDCLVKTST